MEMVLSVPTTLDRLNSVTWRAVIMVAPVVSSFQVMGSEPFTLYHEKM